MPSESAEGWLLLGLRKSCSDPDPPGAAVELIPGCPSFPPFPIWCQTPRSCGEKGGYRPVWALFSWIIYAHRVSQGYKCGAGSLSQDRSSHINIQKTQGWSIQTRMYLHLNYFFAHVCGHFMAFTFLKKVTWQPKRRAAGEARLIGSDTFSLPRFRIVNHFANTPPPYSWGTRWTWQVRLMLSAHPAAKTNRWSQISTSPASPSKCGGWIGASRSVLEH